MTEYATKGGLLDAHGYFTATSIEDFLALIRSSEDLTIDGHVTD